MISLESLIGALTENRCILGRVVLSDSEMIFSRAKLPSFYSDKIQDSDKRKIGEFVKALLINRNEFQEFITRSPETALRLRRFFGSCISKGDGSDESILHAYIYLFWQDFLKSVDIPGMLSAEPIWGSKDFGLSSLESTQSYKHIVDILRRSGVESDLVLIDPSNQSIGLIELKRGSLDDRAVGQILRYYKAVWDFLKTSDFRKLNINYVKPILIVQDIRPQQLAAIPVHFQGLLEILKFDLDVETNLPEFRSYRRSAFSEKWL